MAKELIISIYDGGWGDFTAVVLNENKIEEISKDMESSLAKFGLYHRGDNVEVSITNEKVKQFDRIVVCEDGRIEVYVDGKKLVTNNE